MLPWQRRKHPICVYVCGKTTYLLHMGNRQCPKFQTLTNQIANGQWMIHVVVFQIWIISYCMYVCHACMHACMHGKHTFTILYCLSSSTYSLPTISHIFLQCRISFPTKTKREKRRASMVKNLHWERVSSWEDLMRLRYSANIWILFLWYLGSHLR